MIKKTIKLNIMKETYTRSEVIEMLDNLLQYPDQLIDAVTNENTDWSGDNLLEMVEAASTPAPIASNGWVAIDYDNIPKGEWLLLTTSKVILKGDWYKTGWRTERSKWISTEDCSRTAILSTTPKEEVTHYHPLPSIASDGEQQ